MIKTVLERKKKTEKNVITRVCVILEDRLVNTEKKKLEN